MPRLLAVSPHLDDAVFSAGGTLAMRAREGWQVMVATVFTLTVPDPRGFALACQLDKGLGPDVDYMALRRAEDVAACAAIGATFRHLPFPEAPHRGYASAPALFAGVLEDDEIAAPLSAAITELLRELQPDFVLGPAGIGNHVDHFIVRDILYALPTASLQLWDDWPYADRGTHEAGNIVVTLDADARMAKATAAHAYASQLGFQFGGDAALDERLSRIWSERFRVPTSLPILAI